MNCAIEAKIKEELIAIGVHVFHFYWKWLLHLPDFANCEWFTILHNSFCTAKNGILLSMESLARVMFHASRPSWSWSWGMYQSYNLSPVCLMICYWRSTETLEKGEFAGGIFCWQYSTILANQMINSTPLNISWQNTDLAQIRTARIIGKTM